VGPDTIVDPGALVEGGYTVDGENPDPTTALFITGEERLGAFYGDVATALFCTSLFAALLAFHNNVARYFYALGREGVIPKAFGRVNPRTGAPFVGSLTQTLLAVTVIAVFAILDEDPVLKLFTWLTNMGTLGVIFLMAVTSFAVVAYFRKRPDHELGPVRTAVAPVIAGVLLLGILVLGVANFNVLITGSSDAPTDTMTIVLPLILVAAGVLGMIVAAVMRRSRPEAYANIGERTVTEEVEHVA
jgi:amino acid transporter